MSGLVKRLARGAGNWLRRLVLAVVVGTLIAVLMLILPHSLPGELAPAQLTVDNGPAATRQIDAVGVLAEERTWSVNILFHAPPADGARVALQFAGGPGALTLVHRGIGWSQAGGKDAAPARLLGLATRGNLVVFRLTPPAAQGVAVASGAGGRLPQSGFAALTYPAPPHFDLTDAVLIALLAATAWFAFRRGARRELTALVAVALGLAAAIVIYRPLAGWFASWTGTSLAAVAIVSGLLVVIATLVGLIVTPRLMRVVAPLIARWPKPIDGPTAALLACVRQLPLLAMFLMIGVNVALFRWAAADITSSLFGSLLLHTVRAAFGPQ